MLKNALLCVIVSLNTSLKKTLTKAESRNTQGMLVNNVKKSQILIKIFSKLKNAEDMVITVMV